MGCARTCCHAARLTNAALDRDAMRSRAYKVKGFWNNEELNIHLSGCCHAPTFLRSKDDRTHLYYCSMCSKRTTVPSQNVGMDYCAATFGDSVYSTPNGFIVLSPRSMWCELFEIEA